MGRVRYDGVPAVAGSALGLDILRANPGATLDLGDPQCGNACDSLAYVFQGSGSVHVGDSAEGLHSGSAALLLAGERGEIRAGQEGIRVVVANVSAQTDRHAPLGPRETVARLDSSVISAATGSRSFQILFGPHNGSTRATLFVGFVPPGRAPWHYHLYDEIVWIPEGPARLHLGDDVRELGPEAAFRLRPREVHIIENASPDRELTIVGVFTPAGSPTAAFLEPDVAAEYRFTSS